MATDAASNLELCFPYELKLEGKSFEEHLKSTTRLIITGQQMIGRYWRNIYEPKSKQTCLQSQKSIKKGKGNFFLKFVKLI